MNFQQQEQFYQMVKRSRAASLSTKEAEMITEVHDGLIVTRPAKKVEYLSEPSKTNSSQPEAQAKVWNLTSNGPVLQQESKAASVPGNNKMKAIHDFITFHY